MTARLTARLVRLALVIGTVVGCSERAGVPASPCHRTNTMGRIQVEYPTRVDVLFMVDNSNSMETEQAALAREFPVLLNILATGDFDQDGRLDGAEDFPAVGDLNVGVVTSDMGAGQTDLIASCRSAGRGDDGILQNTVRLPETSSSPCHVAGRPRDFPPFLNFQPGIAEDGDSAQLAVDFTCIASVGIDGCGFEQPLEAVLKATSPANPTTWTRPGYVAPEFVFGTGHGDGANVGFLRDDAVLALILLTDEDDCSIVDQDLFNPGSRAYGGVELSERCFTFEDEALMPVERYVDGFLALRRTPQQLVFAPIVGIPPDLAPPGGLGGPTNFSRILGDARMQVRQESGRFVPSCEQPGVGEAFAPRRIVRVAEGLQEAGAEVTVQSICDDSYGEALRGVAAKLARALSGGSCLPRPLPVGPDGALDCQMFVDVPADSAGCGEVVGWDGREPELSDDSVACRLNQLVPSAEERDARAAPTRTATGELAAGWYYDDYTAAGQARCQRGEGAAYQRLAFTALPPRAASVRLECLVAVLSGDEGVPVAGDGCTPRDDSFCPFGTAPDDSTPLACNPVDRVCSVACTDDRTCVDAGLVGHVCDLRTRCEADPDFCGTDSADEPLRFCANPTCR